MSYQVIIHRQSGDDHTAYYDTLDEAEACAADIRTNSKHGCKVSVESYAPPVDSGRTFSPLFL